MDRPLPESHCLEQKIEKILKSTESPFTWMPNRQGFQDVSPKYILEKCVDKSYTGNVSKYSRYMRAVFEMGIQNDDKVNQVWQEWEDFFLLWEKQAREKSLEKGAKKDKFVIKYNIALKHVLYSSKAHLLLKKQDYEQVEPLIETIEKLRDASSTFKAGICGLKAKFFCVYSGVGCGKALPYTKEALNFDPNEPKWIRLTAQVMRGIRIKNKRKKKQSKEEELYLHEKLVSIKKKGKNLCLLANSHIDIGHELHYKKVNHRCNRYRKCGECLEIQGYFYKGVECFKEAMRIDPNQYIYFQVVRGISSIPRFYSHEFKRIAENCVNNIVDDKGNVKNDDNRGFQIYYAIGRYYEELGQNPQKSLEYIKKSADLGGRNAKKDLICMKFNEDSSYDPHEDIAELITCYERGPMVVECLCQLACYYWFKNDLLKAVEYILQVIEYDPGFNYRFVKSLQSWFHKKRRSQKSRNIQLLREITYSVSLHLRKLDSKALSEENQKLAEFIEQVRKVSPEEVRDIAPYEVEGITAKNVRGTALEDIRETVQGDVRGTGPEVVRGTVPEDVLETVPGDVPGTVPEDVRGTGPEVGRGTVPEDVLETVPGDVPGTVPEVARLTVPEDDKDISQENASNVAQKEVSNIVEEVIRGITPEQFIFKLNLDRA